VTRRSKVIVFVLPTVCLIVAAAFAVIERERIAIEWYRRQYERGDPTEPEQAARRLIELGAANLVR